MVLKSAFEHSRSWAAIEYFTSFGNRHPSSGTNKKKFIVSTYVSRFMSNFNENWFRKISGTFKRTDFNNIFSVISHWYI